MPPGGAALGAVSGRLRPCFSTACEDFMDSFLYRNGELFAENVPVSRIAAEVGTPTYVYSKGTLLMHYRRLAEAFAALSPLICYSAKSCGNIHVLRTLVETGSGMDVTSGG